MGKTLSLIIASLKSFMRDWKSVLLLMISPLLIIFLIFISFHPDGLQRIPVGVISEDSLRVSSDTTAGLNSENEFIIPRFMVEVQEFLKITNYYKLHYCLDDLQRQKVYLCIEFIENKFIQLNIHYDNTRNLIPQQIINQIKEVMNVMKSEMSKETVEYFMSELENTLFRIEDFKGDLENTNKDIGKYIIQINNTQNEMELASSELDSSIESMDQDVSEARDSESQAVQSKNSMYSEIITFIYSADSILNQLYSYTNNSGWFLISDARAELDEIKSEVDHYNNEANQEFSTIDNKLSDYEESSQKGKEFSHTLKYNIQELDGVSADLETYQGEVSEGEEEIDQIINKYSTFLSVDPEVLVNPLTLKSFKTYVPEFLGQGMKLLLGASGATINRSALFKENPGLGSSGLMKKALNSITMQIVYPNILLLITLFLAILIANFITLEQINSPANERLKIIKGMFFPEVISVFISSLLIVLAPLLCVLLLGEFIFKLNIFSNFILVFPLMILMVSFFLLVGMITAYTFKKKSTSLIVGTFVIVFFVFLSGFVLPVEMMTDNMGFIASSLPGKVALSAFSKIVFYGSLGGTSTFGIMNIVNFHNLWIDFMILFAWFIILSITTIIIKKLRE